MPLHSNRTPQAKSKEFLVKLALISHVFFLLWSSFSKISRSYVYYTSWNENRTVEAKSKEFLLTLACLFQLLWSSLSNISRFNVYYTLWNENRTLEAKSKDFLAKLAQIFDFCSLFRSPSKTSRPNVYHTTLEGKSNCKRKIRKF